LDKESNIVSFTKGFIRKGIVAPDAQNTQFICFSFKNRNWIDSKFNLSVGLSSK
jgi:hypothetical protein